METQKINLYHFSPVTVVLSLLFLVINLFFFSVIFVKEADFERILPQIIFGRNQEVQLSTPFQQTPFDARSGQDLLTLSNLKTGESSFAEVKLGQNAIRLDQNTEIKFLKNNIEDLNEPRLSFQLIQGRVWVNAIDSIEILSDSSTLIFDNTLGYFEFNNGLNEAGSFFGQLEANLNLANNAKTTFVIPAQFQIRFANSQLVTDYQRLEYSKLKKELKLSPISQDLMETGWVQTKLNEESSEFTDSISSKNSYEFKRKLAGWWSYLAIGKSRKAQYNLAKAELDIRYLLGGLHENNLDQEADIVLEELSQLENDLHNNQDFFVLIRFYFEEINKVKGNSVAYEAKDKLRDILLAEQQDFRLLRSYLNDVDFLLHLGALNQTEAVAKKWLANWKPELRKSNQVEWQLQSRLYHQLALAYADRIDAKYLSFLSRLEDVLLEDGYPILERAQERLEIAKALVASARYPTAKSYLRESYDKLNLDSSSQLNAAQNLFLKEGALLSDRIAFAEQSLRGSATEIDEVGFRQYLNEQERDKTLAERFNELLGNKNEPVIEVPVGPNAENIIQRFAEERVVVLNQDISVNANSPFVFDIKEASLVDRRYDGERVSFSGSFDSSTNALYNLEVNSEPFSGSFSLEDFVRVALANGEGQIGKDEEIELSLEDILRPQSNEDVRSQIVAQDLAIQLVIKELEENGVYVSKKQQVSILNQDTLQQFKISDVSIQSAANNKTLQLDFDYDADQKIISNIVFKDSVAIQVPSQIPANQFISSVFGRIVDKEREQALAIQIQSSLSTVGLVLDLQDFRFVEGSQSVIDFNQLSLKSMPIQFSGTYDHFAKRFPLAEHPLYSAKNISVSDYVSELALRWTLDYLAQKGIEISAENISSSLPATQIGIQNYQRGDRVLSFVFDVVNNRLVNIAVQGEGGVVNEMSFDDFALIQ